MRFFLRRTQQRVVSVSHRWFITRIFFVRFVRGFFSIPNVGTNPPPVLRLSDGGHFENLALLPLLEKKLPKIVIADGSCNPGGDRYADELLKAVRIAREKLHCWFEGIHEADSDTEQYDGRDIEEDIRVKLLSKDKDGKLPRKYRFRVHYCDDGDGEPTEGEIIYMAPRHPRESKPLKEEPMLSWKSFRQNDENDLGAESRFHELWGQSPVLSEDEANKLNWCCCSRCHINVKCDCCCDCCQEDGICHWLSSRCLGEFPHHVTANQFFTPDMFTAYHREGYAAYFEANIPGDFYQPRSRELTDSVNGFNPGVMS